MPTQNVLGVGGCHLPSQSCTSPSHLATTLHRFVSLFARDWVMIVGSLRPAIFILATGWYKRRSSLWDHGKLNLSDIRVGRELVRAVCVRPRHPSHWTLGLVQVCFSWCVSLLLFCFIHLSSPSWALSSRCFKASPGLEGSVEVCTVII